MIKKELLSEVSESKKFIAFNVIAQIIKLLASIMTIFSFAYFVKMLYNGENIEQNDMFLHIAVIILCIIIRFVCTAAASMTSFYASAEVKKKLRVRMYDKLTRLGASYHEKVATSEVIQVFVEGVDQLETYFGRYIPQFFYSMIAPLLLFAALAPISLKASVVLFICVPLIPISIVIVQKIAKRLLSKYWGKYTQLGDTFLENIQGLTTLKIFGADAQKHVEMNEKAEEFRVVTMKVLTMQLNSIIIMDLVAYGGAAVGVIIAVSEVLSGKIEMWDAFKIIMLSADFFLPMRALGSFFHIAMNGMAASDKMFAMLRLDEGEKGAKELLGNNYNISAKHLTFSYDGDRNALDDVSLELEQGKLTAVVGESGCGKSTFAALVTGAVKGHSGDLTIGGENVYELKTESIYDNITIVSSNSVIFAETIRENMLLGKPDASDEEMIAALKSAKIWDFLQTQNGLDMKIQANAANLSGGQRQRIALARGLLRNSPIYVFDEATSNIDVESENDIMATIRSLNKTVLLITHRLENAVSADRIYVLDGGKCIGCGKHTELMQNCPKYNELYSAQAEYEKYSRNGVTV